MFVFIRPFCVCENILIGSKVAFVVVVVDMVAKKE